MEDAQPSQAEEEEEEEDLLASGSQQPQSLTFQHLRDGSGGEQDLKRAVTMNLHGKSLASTAALEECPNLRSLDLSFNLIVDIEGISSLSKLKELKLYDNRIASLAGLQNLSSLHTLDISSNSLNSLEGLKSLRGLRVLRASHNGLSSLNSLGRWASGLEALDISYNKLQDLDGLSPCTALRELGAAGNALGKGNGLRGLSRCACLMELYAPGNGLTSLHGLKAAAATLDILDVSSNNLVSLEGMPEGCVNLHELYASDNRLKSIAGLARCAPNLETLEIGDNPLALSVFASLTAGERPPSPTSIDPKPNAPAIPSPTTPGPPASSSRSSSSSSSSKPNSRSNSRSGLPGKGRAGEGGGMSSHAPSPTPHPGSREAGASRSSSRAGAVPARLGPASIPTGRASPGMPRGKPRSDALSPAPHSAAAVTPPSAQGIASSSTGGPPSAPSVDSGPPFPGAASRHGFGDALQWLAAELKSLPELSYVRLEGGDAAEAWGRRGPPAYPKQGEKQTPSGSAPPEATEQQQRQRRADAAGLPQPQISARAAASDLSSGARAKGGGAQGARQPSLPILLPPPGYRDWLFAAVPQLEVVDEEERPPAPVQGPDVWVNTQGSPTQNGPRASLDELLQGVDPHLLEPSAQEMEAFKRRMGIRSSLSIAPTGSLTRGVAGESANLQDSWEGLGDGGGSGGRGTSAEVRGSGSGSIGVGGGPPSARTSVQQLQQQQRPASALGRPASASVRHSQLIAAMSASQQQRAGGGAARPWSGGSSRGTGYAAGAGGGVPSRPGSAFSSSGLTGSGVRDVMMHQRPPSARTGGAARLLTPQQYTQSVVEFGETLDIYRQQLSNVLSNMREGLKLDMTAAAEQAKAPGVDAAHQLPVMPIMPQMPRHMLRKAVVGSPAERGQAPQLPGSKPAASPARGVVLQGSRSSSLREGSREDANSLHLSTATNGGEQDNKNAAGGGLVRIPELDDPQVAAALAEFHRLFPSVAPAASATQGPHSPQPNPPTTQQQQQQQQQQDGRAGAGQGLPQARGPGFVQGEDEDEDDDRGVLLRGGGEEEEDEEEGAMQAGGLQGEGDDAETEGYGGEHAGLGGNDDASGNDEEEEEGGGNVDRHVGEQGLRGEKGRTGGAEARNRSAGMSRSSSKPGTPMRQSLILTKGQPQGADTQQRPPSSSSSTAGGVGGGGNIRPGLVGGKWGGGRWLAEEQARLPSPRQRPPSSSSHLEGGSGGRPGLVAGRWGGGRWTEGVPTDTEVVVPRGGLKARLPGQALQQQQQQQRRQPVRS